jgi:enoyl-CoA hydratase
VALAAVRRAQRLESVEHALEMEFGISCALMYGGDGVEGVRALIIDKDRSPRWNPPTLDAVTEELVAGVFAEPAYGTLGLV